MRALRNLALAPAGSILAALALLATHTFAADRTGEAFFESKIRPLLVERCIECHGSDEQERGLRLDSRVGWERGGESGPALVPGKPNESLLILAVSYLDKNLQMPPDEQLPASDVALLQEWVRRGAPDPRVGAVTAIEPSDDQWAEAFQERLDWWSLKSLHRAQPPVVNDAAWSHEPVDCFLRAALDAAGLAPAAPAEPEVLLRRLTFVLTGIPPTPQQRERFLQRWQDDASSAYERLVDELIASPHFGERFARHWMDVVRYSDTFGWESDHPANGSWEYRDYLIRALNQDVGFDQLVLEQISGDLLPDPRINSEMGINESVIGPVFYHMGEHREGGSLRFNGVHQQMVDNKIDAFSKAFLALTVACARCHDHKLEAVSQRDYYALAAVFITPRWTSRVIDAPGKNDAAIARLQELRGEIRREMAALWRAAATRKETWSADVFQQALEVKDAPETKLDDVAHPLVRLRQAEGDVAKLWNELATEWRQTRAQRLKANAEFQPIADFQEPKVPDGWVMEGDGMKHGHVEDGTPLVALEGDLVVARLLRRGFHTHALSSKLPGTLRMPPQHAVPGQIVSMQLAGGEFSGTRVVEENGFLAEGVEFLKTTEPVWQSFSDKTLFNGVTKVMVEFTTSSLNPSFRPRVGIDEGSPKSDPGYAQRSSLSIMGIFAHEKSGAPQDTLEHFRTLYEGDAPKSDEEAGRRIREWFTGPIQRWCEGETQAGDVRVLNWLLVKKLLPNRAEEGSRLAALLAEYRHVEQGIAYPRTVTGMDEREMKKTSYPLNPRGNVDVVGESIPPDFLQMFASQNNVAKSPGSGRLELAQSLVHSEHPLTSRVYVNRVWKWIFGSGIVATPDDFGHLGDKPSHPELLDYLAREFVRESWSTKRLVRRLVLSQAFRQSGTVSEAARQRDPENRLLHHYPTRRLEAEAIRDALLAVSGRLDPKLYGRPVDPPRAAEDTLKRLFSGPLDGQGRRSIYLKLSIMEPPKFLVSFNFPDHVPTGKRDFTNVPAQSLLMLNDPFVHAMARHWASQFVKQPHTSTEERITAMFVRAFGRMPDEAELIRWSAASREFATVGGLETMADEAVWKRLAHMFFNAKEFIYYR